MRSALVPGGSVSEDAMVRAAESGEALAAAFNATLLEGAAQLGAQAMRGGTMTAFELACDNAVAAYLSGAEAHTLRRGAGCGVSLPHRERDTAARMILTGRLGGIAPEVIRERLRDINA